MSPSSPTPGADDARRDLIVMWHARGHAMLDHYDVPRMADGIEYTLAERIERLAELRGIKAVPRQPGISAAPVNYFLAAGGHEMVCRSCGEGTRAKTFDEVAHWRDQHQCPPTDPLPGELKP